MPKLSNITRPAGGYAIGGVDVLLLIPTKENGKQTLVITPGTTPKDLATVAIAPSVTALPSLIDFSKGGDNVCSCSDNTSLGPNTFLTPAIGFKLDEADDNGLSESVEALTFQEHSGIVKTKTGKYKVLGAGNGMKATQANNGGDGGASSFAGYDLVLTGAEVKPAVYITKESFEALLELVP